LLASVSLLRVSNLAKAKHRGKAQLFRGAWTGQRNHRQACLQASPYCECPIWRKPNTEEKRSFFEVPGRDSGTIGKLACKRLLIASVQFGESQTPRKSEAFSRWPGRRSGRTNMARFLTMHTMFDFFFKKYCIYLYFVILYPHNEWIHKESEMDKKERIEKQIGTLKGIREMLDMNRTEFSRYMDIPLRTLEEWEAGRRQMPEYVLRLIAYYVKVQKLMKEKGIELEERYEQK